MVRTVLSFIVAGALLAVLAASFFGPKYIAWDNTVGSGASAMCVCQEVALQGAQRMISMQMNWCAIGAILGGIGGGVFVFMRRKAAPAPTV
ncbi:MAG: hypothetical protein QM817_37035 [Archangium sp.]